MVVKRGVVATCNVLFPPLAVYLLCGAGEDLLINSVLFLLAVIPSHVHGFYLSWTYFNRKRKIRKGQYPGGRRPMIYSDKVQNGGATSKEVRQFKRERVMEKKEKELKKKQEGGRVRRLFRKIAHREDDQSVGSYSYDDGEIGYIEPITPSYESSTIQRQTSRRGADPARLSRHSTRSHSQTVSIETNQIPRHRESAKRSHPPRAILQSSLLKRTGTNHTSRSRRNSYSEDTERSQQPPLPRRPSMGARSNSRRSVRSDGESLSDYVARPSLPQRPGTSYRDDIDRWRQSVPVEAY